MTGVDLKRQKNEKRESLTTTIYTWVTYRNLKGDYGETITSNCFLLLKCCINL